MLTFSVRKALIIINIISTVIFVHIIVIVNTNILGIIIIIMMTDQGKSCMRASAGVGCWSIEHESRRLNQN